MVLGWVGDGEVKASDLLEYFGVMECDGWVRGAVWCGGVVV